MTTTELFLDYGIAAALIIAAVFLTVVAFKIGYMWGQQNGYRAGYHRGMRFGHLKLHEHDNGD